MGTKRDGQQTDTCGLLGACNSSPRFQQMANLKLYSFVIGLVVVGVSASYSYMSAVVTTTQQVYSFSAVDIGAWYAMFEVGAILSNLIVSYFFAKKHIPRILSIGLILVIIGTVVHGLPHFFLSYEDKIKSTDGNATASDFIELSLCNGGQASIPDSYDINSTTTSSDVFSTQSTVSPKSNCTNTAPDEKEAAELTNSTTAIIIYCIGAFLSGLGYAPFWSLGLVYIHNNVKQGHSASKYIAVILMFYTLGPIVGFGAGAYFLNFYVTLGETYLTPEDPQWIGAWWLGYLVFTALLCLCLLPIMMFPFSIPRGSAEPPQDVVSLSHKKMNVASTMSTEEILKGVTYEEEEEEKMGEKDTSVRSVKGVVPTLVRLLTNPLYMAEVLASCFGVYYISGWLGFLPKYFETAFHLTASEANIYGGLLPPILSTITIFLGGYIGSKYKLSTEQEAKLIFFSLLISSVIIIPTIFLTCTQYPVQDALTNLYTNTTLECDCDVSSYTPVCLNGVTSYQSPCVAGCTGHYSENTTNQLMYTGCLDNNITLPSGGCMDEATCFSPYIYTVCCVISWASFMFCSSAAVNIIMRCVDEDDRSIALGLQSSLNSLLAWIPAPVLYGFIIDGTCKIWEYPDGSPEDPEWFGYCMEYDNTDYRHQFTGITLAMNFLMSVSAGIGWAASKMQRYTDLDRAEKEKAEEIENGRISMIAEHDEFQLGQQ